MIKKTTQLVSLIILSLFLASCQSKVSDAEAAEMFVKGEFYLSDVLDDDKFIENYGKAFGEQLSQETIAASNRQLLTDLTKQEFSQDDSLKILKEVSQQLKEKTSFKAEVIQEAELAAVVNISINGLDKSAFNQKIQQLQDQALLTKIQDGGYPEITELTQLKELSSAKELADIEQLVADFEGQQTLSLNDISQALDLLKQGKETKSVYVKLIKSEKDTQQWQVDNKDETIKALAEAFNP